jgi:Bax protein
MKKTFSLTFLFLLVLPVLFSGGCRDTQPASDEALLFPPQRVSPDSYRDIVKTFESYGYSWETVAQGVPPLILTRMPEDLNLTPHVSDKKELFYLSLLPMALMLNEDIAHQRQQMKHILSLIEGGDPLTLDQQVTLSELRRQYLIKGDPATSKAARRELRKRVDTLPPSLLLAQAANESGYGSSRFAREANNLFGEWTFTPGTGLVPEDRPEGETYEVRVFDTVYDSLKSYLRNINTHWAYTSLRKERARIRKEGRIPRGVELAGGLELYSTRRGAYVEEIRAMIRNNNLSELSRTELRSPIQTQRYGRPKESILEVAYGQNR